MNKYVRLGVADFIHEIVLTRFIDGEQMKQQNSTLLLLLKSYFRVALKSWLSHSVFEISALDTYCYMNLANLGGEKP